MFAFQKKYPLFFAVPFVCFTSLFCRPPAQQVSRNFQITRNSGTATAASTSAQSCQSKIKQEILTSDDVTDDPQSKLDDHPGLFLDLIKGGALVEKSFSHSFKETKPSETKELEYEQIFQKNDAVVTKEISLTYSPPIWGKLDPYFTKTVTITYDNKGLPKLKLKKIFRIESKSCRPEIIEISRESFQYQDQAQVVYESEDFLNKVTNSTKSELIPLQTLKNTAQFRTQKANKSMIISQKTFQGYTGGKYFLVFEIHPHAVNPKVSYDPLIAKPTRFDVFRIEVRINNELVATGEQQYSSSSDTSTQILNGEAQQSTNQKTWASLDLTSATSSTTRNIPVTGFKPQDFQSYDLYYTVETSGVRLTYDNYKSYFQLTESKGPSGFLYTVKHHEPKIEQALLEPFSPQQEGNNPFLKETDFINVSDPKTKQLIAEIKLKLQTIPGGAKVKDAIYEILDSTTNNIKYDDNALEKDSVGIMSSANSLKRGSGVCQHFAAVFVSLARGLGIPSRVISGYALDASPVNGTQTGSAKPGSATGHAWVEVQLPHGQWWPVEPQNNKNLDLAPGYFPVGVEGSYEVTQGTSTTKTTLMTNAFYASALDAVINFKK